MLCPHARGRGGGGVELCEPHADAGEVDGKDREERQRYRRWHRRARGRGPDNFRSESPMGQFHVAG